MDYECPNCKYIDLDIKNKKGVFVDQSKGRPIMILIWTLVIIAAAGILASIILASINSAKQKSTTTSLPTQTQNQ